MKHLHAYWRMQYIEAPKPVNSATVFEDIPKATDDKSVHLLYRGRTGYIVLNRFPYNAGHLLVIPYRAAASLAELSPEERADLMDLLVLGQQILADALHPDGFNVGFNFGSAAGAGIPRHLHAHIVPRWDGDSNFMPVLGDARVLVDSLDSMWERLRAFCPKSETP
jgi:ATP adenylyltransferase